MDKISIIIRTKNEEKWIERCLNAIAKQDYPNFEVIVVDNDSTDNTLDIVLNHGIVDSLGKISRFNYSYALNQGIEKSTGKFIACLSGHCIPTNNKWLSNLHMNFDLQYVAGVYGRQEPLPETSNLDKRDLLITFGLDRKVQKTEPFFHNANSMIRKKLWVKHRFDETLNGQEDRAWAKKMLDMGKVIVYEPKASVYHYHGIHHNRDKERAARVVDNIKKIK